MNMKERFKQRKGPILEDKGSNRRQGLPKFESVEEVRASIKGPVCVHCESYDPKSNPFWGLCKAVPPTPIVDANGNFAGVFPPVKATQWCGIFTQREEEPAEDFDRFSNINDEAMN